MNPVRVPAPDISVVLLLHDDFKRNQMLNVQFFYRW